MSGIVIEWINGFHHGRVIDTGEEIKEIVDLLHFFNNNGRMSREGLVPLNILNFEMIYK